MFVFVIAFVFSGWHHCVRDGSRRESYGAQDWRPQRRKRTHMLHGAPHLMLISMVCSVRFQCVPCLLRVNPMRGGKRDMRGSESRLHNPPQQRRDTHKHIPTVEILDAGLGIPKKRPRIPIPIIFMMMRTACTWGGKRDMRAAPRLDVKPVHQSAGAPT